uniref:Protein TIC 214 n=1 Tax=Dendrotrophe varians TaxID=50123 RepID=A0A343S8W6_9MAGN|nr:ycf1 protein [Dendrotrophe varians]AUN45157.1 ycf1 protein [Dendrotrophe varians]
MRLCILALGRPHIITVLVLPYFLFNFFFWNNHKNFFDYGSTTRNSMRNLSIQCIFLNNLILQLFNHLILPSSMLARLVNIYMFRYNKKMLFVTSSFLGWLMGHILFIKWVGLVLVFWIRQNHSIRSNTTYMIRSNKYLVSELRNYMARILSILLFLTCVYYLVRIPSPILTNKLKETSEMEERGDSEEEEETGVEIEKTSGTKEGQEISTEDPSTSLFSEEKRYTDKIDETKEKESRVKEKTKNELSVSETHYLDDNPKNLTLKILKKNKEDKKNLVWFWFEQPIVTLLFDYKKQWNRPLRYIKNDQFENAVRNEISQYFFYTCPSDGKRKISFTYPSSLLTFLEMIQRYLSLSTENLSSNEQLYNYWIDTNEQKKNKQSDEFIKRIEALDKKSRFNNILEQRTRLCNCNNETKNKEYLPKIYDPFVNGSYRGTTKKLSSPSITNKTFIENSIETVWINKIHGIFFEDRDFFLITLLNKKVIRKKSIGVKKIRKKIPQWSYKLIDELEQQEGENENDLVAEDHHEIRSRKAKRVVLFTNDYQKSYTYDTYTNTKETLDPDQADEVALIRYSQQSDFRRYIIKGSVRIQRRKTGIWELFQANTHSPLFLDRIRKLFFYSFEISKLMKFFFRNGMVKISKFKISNYKEEERKEMGKNEEDNKRKEKMRIEIAEAWDTILFAQVIRGCMLVTQSILRKYMILPSLIIAKNISRIFFFQFPEWSDDLKEWKREMHVKCTYNGVQLSEKEFPKNWSTDGIQIKILFPFCLKPWHRSKLRSLHRDPMTKKRKKIDFSFLTVWGMESELPFGSPRKRPSFFEPIFKKLEKKIIKFKNQFFLVIRVLKEKKWFLRISKKTKKWVIKKFLLFLLKRRIKNLSKVKKIIIFFGLKEDESSQTKKEKYSIINNRMIHELSIQKGFMNGTKHSLTEKKMKNLTDRTNTIINQIERIKKDKKKGFLTPDIQMSPKKRSYKPKIRLESPKNILKIFKAQLTIKSYFFIKYFIEKMYDILLCIIKNIPSLNAQLFLELTKKKFDKKYIYSEANQDRIDKTNQTTIYLISTIKKSLYYISNSNNSKNSSQIFCDLSLSQTYVFYKLSKIQVNNLDKFIDVLQYHGTSFFLKNEIKDFFGIKGIFHPDSQFRHKKLRKYETKQWKNWLLRGHYQYDLSPIRWSQLVSQKWQNRVNQHDTVQNINLNKWNFYEKVQLIHYKKQTDFYEENSFSNKKYNLKKYYKYDKRSYNTINYEYRNASYIYGSSLHVRLQVKKNKERIDSYNYYKTHKRKLLDLLGPIHNYLGEDGIRDLEKNMKVWWDFDCRIPHFCLKKLYIGTLMDIDTGTNSNQNMKTGTKIYQIIDQMDKNQKDLLYLKIHQEIESSNSKSFLNWMGMNEEILNSPRSNTGLWFFPELVILCNKYKMKQWVIPIKLLLSNFNENVWENKNINAKQKNIFISSNEKYFELENLNKESTGPGNLGSDVQNQDNLESILSNQQKNLEEDYESNIKKRRKKKQYKSHTEAELDLFLKRYFIFHQLRWNDSLNHKIINNIKVYCLLLRQINPKEMALSSIQRGEFCLDLMLTQKYFTLTELIKTGILIIEPVRRSVKNDRQFIIMYQTVGISLVHKSKHQTNQSQEKSVDNKKNKKSIERHQKKLPKKDEKNYYVFVPENFLSAKRCREFRIRIEINSRNRKNVNNRNPTVLNRNNVKNCSLFLDENEHFDNRRDKTKLIQLKFFLWPNYRLEDLTCVNRYWYDTNNGSRFSLLRICPQVIR